MFISKIKNNQFTFETEYNQARFNDFLVKNEGKSVKIEAVKERSARTEAQNNSIWLFLTKLATALNDAGLDQRKVLKPTYNLDWDKDSIHDHLWLPIQKALYKTESTTQLKKLEQIDKIHSLIMRELAEKFGVEYIPFPSNEEQIGRNYKL